MCVASLYGAVPIQHVQIDVDDLTREPTDTEEGGSVTDMSDDNTETNENDTALSDSNAEMSESIISGPTARRQELERKRARRSAKLSDLLKSTDDEGTANYGQVLVPDTQIGWGIHHNLVHNICEEQVAEPNVAGGSADVPDSEMPTGSGMPADEPFEHDQKGILQRELVSSNIAGGPVLSGVFSQT